MRPRQPRHRLAALSRRRARLHRRRPEAPEPRARARHPRRRRSRHHLGPPHPHRRRQLGRRRRSARRGRASATRSTSSTAATSCARSPPPRPPPPTPPPTRPPTSAPRNPPSPSASTNSAPPAAAAPRARRRCRLSVPPPSRRHARQPRATSARRHHGAPIGYSAPGSSHAATAHQLTTQHPPCPNPAGSRWPGAISAWPRRPAPHHTDRVVRYYADVGHAADHQRRDRLVRRLPRLVPGARRHRQHPLADGALLSRLGRARSPSSRPGAIAVLSRTADPALGHVGFLVGETADRHHPARRQPERRRHRRSLPPRPPPRPALACHRIGRRSPPPVIPDGAPAPIRDPGAASDAAFEPRPRPRARNGRRLDRRPLRSRRPHQLRHHARHLRPRQGRRAHRRQLRRAQSRAEIHPARHRAPHLSRALLAARPPARRLPPPLAFFHFDAAVNQGVTGAARLLQEAVGAEIDGEIGPRDAGQGRRAPVPETLALYADARRRHYRSLSTFWRFGKGWLARVDRTLAAALRHRRAPRPPAFPRSATGASTHDRYNPAAARRHRPTPNGGASR